MSHRVLALVVLASSLMAWSPSADAQLSEMAERFKRMGKDAMNNFEWPDCVENFTQVIEIDSEDIDSWIDLGYCQEKLRQFDAAAESYEAALGSVDVERRPELLGHLAFAHASSGKLDKAVKHYNELVSLTPDDKIAWVGMGFTYKNMEKVPEAIMAYERALELDPNDVDLIKTLGELCQQNGLLEQSVAMYKRWAELEQQNVEPRRFLAYLHYQLESCEQGTRLYQEVLALDQTNPGDVLNLGLLYQKCGKFEQALDSFKKYKEQRPDDCNVECRIAFLYEDVGRYNEGITAIAAAAERCPTDGCLHYAHGRLLDKLGTALVDQKKFDQGIARYKEALARFQKVLGDATWGRNAQKQLDRLEKLIERAEKLKLQEEEGF